MSAPARVLVVDDSPTMRGLITAVLSSDPEVNVIGQAGDALEAREAIKRLNPDVLTLDIEMPNMNGLDFLEKIMTLRPMPVIMVSTMTHRGAKRRLRHLRSELSTASASLAPVNPGRSVISPRRSRRRRARSASSPSRRLPSRLRPPSPISASAGRSSRSVRPQAASRR